MNDYGYGLWFLVVVNSAVLIIFAASFFHPQNGRDWRALGGFSAFIVALFAEMYGFPLTIYLLSGPLGDAFDLDLTHNRGHLWSDLAGWQGDPHFSPFHVASYVVIGGGFWAIAAAWRVLFTAQRSGELATTGLYARVRHPQYAGFMAIIVGFLLQWPTLLTLAMFPVLVLVYRHLAIREEADVRAAHPEQWDAYAAATPRFLPRRGNPGRQHGGHGWMMIACCIPMLVIAIVLVATGVAGAGLILAAIMCTAMMWMMMGGMSRPGGR